MDSKVSEKEMRETYLRAFGKEFDSDDRKQPSMPLKIAYLVSLKKLRRQGKFQGGGMITENEYYHIANHFVYFCFNFNTNFVDAFKDHDYEELKSKFWLGYDEKGFYSSVIYFYSQLNKKQKLILSNWIYKNYKGEKLPKSVDSDEYFAVVNNFFDFCINYPKNFLTWFGGEYDYFEAKWNDISNSSDSYSSMVKFWIELSESNRQKLVDGIVSNYKNDDDIEKKSLGGFILGAGLGVVGSYLYNNSTINKENGKIDLSIKKPKNIFKNK